MVDTDSNPTAFKFKVIGFRYEGELIEVPDSWWNSRLLDDVTQEDLDNYRSYLESTFFISHIGSPYDLVTSVKASMWSGSNEAIVEMRPQSYDSSEKSHSIAQFYL